MNITYIILGNGINPAVAGSLMRSASVAKDLVKLGHNVNVITTTGGKTACESLGLTVNYTTIPCWFGTPPPVEKGKLHRIIANLASTVKFPFNFQLSTFNSQLIYTDSDYFFDIFPAIWLKITKKTRWAAMIHHQIKLNKQSLGAFITSILSIITQHITWLIIPLFADTILVYNTPMGEAIAKKLAPLAKLRSIDFNFVNNGIDPEFIKSIKPSKEAYSACMIAGLRPSKGLFDIVPIWKEVVKKVPQATLAVIGAGLEENVNQLKKEISAANLENNIFFLGAKSNSEALSIAKASSIFFFPSHEEGFGIVLAEALALGKPVIAYNLPVYKNTFAENITTIPRWSIDQFAKETARNLHQAPKQMDKSSHIQPELTWENIAQNEARVFEKNTYFDRLPQLMDFKNRARFDFESYLYKHGIINDLQTVCDKLPKNAKVLDLGCGKGHLTAHMKLLGLDAQGTDLEKLDGDQQQIKDPQWRNKYWQMFNRLCGVEYQTFNGSKLPFKNNTFDAVVAYAVIEHVPLQIVNEWLSEIHRVLKPKGRFFIFRCPNKYSYSEKLAKIMHMPAHDKLYTKNELTEQVKKAGFALTKVGRSDFFIEFPPRSLNEVYNKVSPILSLLDKLIMKTPLALISHHLWLEGRKPY